MSLIQVHSAVSGSCLLEVQMGDRDLFASDFVDELKERISSKTGMSCFRQLLLVDDRVIDESFSWEGLGRPNIVKVAFRSFVDNFCNELLEAAFQGNGQHVKVLLRRCQDPNSVDSNGETALWKACAAGHLEVVHIMHEAEADLDLPRHDGCSPLCAASWRGHLEVLQFLLHRQADPNLADVAGRTPLFVAADQGRLTFVSSLLTAQALVDPKDQCQRTPLMIASERGHLAVVCSLLEALAEPDCEDLRGRTPLFNAAELGHRTVVSMLLHRNADAQKADEQGRTPLFVAADGGHLEVVRSVPRSECWCD
ncbi:ANKRD50 [Symbiodinium natans]|uniref:ANKRD50 protein n=1 Tax=Symbiodinium natans TaxID=878477 RepID=A0A812JD80_9DINO|nr:ANKRD50 [Symbiodinium natans]